MAILYSLFLISAAAICVLLYYFGILKNGNLNEQNIITINFIHGGNSVRFNSLWIHLPLIYNHSMSMNIVSYYNKYLYFSALYLCTHCDNYHYIIVIITYMVIVIIKVSFWYKNNYHLLQSITTVN